MFVCYWLLYGVHAHNFVDQFVSVVGAREGRKWPWLFGRRWSQVVGGGQKGLARKVHARNPIRLPSTRVTQKYARRSLIEYVYYDVLSRHMHSLCVRDNRERGALVVLDYSKKSPTTPRAHRKWKQTYTIAKIVSLHLISSHTYVRRPAARPTAPKTLKCNLRLCSSRRTRRLIILYIYTLLLVWDQSNEWSMREGRKIHHRGASRLDLSTAFVYRNTFSLKLHIRSRRMCV